MGISKQAFVQMSVRKDGTLMQVVLNRSAVDAFEDHIRQHPTMGLACDYFLRKLESTNSDNPEYLDRLVDASWQDFRRGWDAVLSSIAMYQCDSNSQG